MAKKPRSTATARKRSISFFSHSPMVEGVREQLLSEACSISGIRKVSKRHWARLDRCQVSTCVQPPKHPKTEPAFLATEYGNRFTAAGFCTKFLTWCNEAKL